MESMFTPVFETLNTKSLVPASCLSAEAGRSASEVHHLFPTSWLHSQGIQDRRIINQVANLADVGWHENSAIGNRSPADYVPRLRDKLDIDDHRWGECALNMLYLSDGSP